MIDIKETELYKNVRPYVILMTVFGLRCSRKQTTTVCPEKSCNSECNSVQRWRFPFSISQCYCLTLITLMVLNGLRLLTVFRNNESFGYILFLKLIMISWYINATVNVIISFWICRTGLMREFMVTWQNMRDFKSSSKSGNALRNVKIAICICVSYTIINTAVITYGIWNEEIMEFVLATFEASQLSMLEDRSIRFFASVITIFQSAAGIIPVGLYCPTSMFVFLRSYIYRITHGTLCHHCTSSHQFEEKKAVFIIPQFIRWLNSNNVAS